MCILAGAMPHERIKAAFADCPAQVEILSCVEDMPALLLDTDLCITAGGSTCWELMCLGVPFLLVEIAENQRMIVQCFIDNYISRKANKKSMSNFLQQTLCTPSAKMLSIVDGNGGRRMFEEMQFFGDKPLSLRPIQKEDALFVLDVVNDPLTRVMCFQSHQISLEEHNMWFAKQMEQGLPFYIAILGKIPCGYTRFDKNEGIANIAVAIAPAFRGKGLSSELIRQSCKKVLEETQVSYIQAYVKKENTASIKAFTKACFVKAKTCNDHKELFYYPVEMM